MKTNRRSGAILTRLPWVEKRLRAAGIDPQTYDFSGAKNFLLAISLLGVSLVLALNGAAAFERGYIRAVAIYHTLALSLAFYVALRLVPPMARASHLKWLLIEVNYKLTREGVAYLVATFIIVLAAVNTGNNLLYIVLASLLAGILISGVASRMVLTGVDLELELPEHIFAQRPLRARFSLHNRKRTLPSFSLTVSSADPKKAGKKKKKKWWRKKADDGNPIRRILNDTVYFPYLPRCRGSTQMVELTFPARGRYTQDTFFLSSKFPFGFLLKTRKIAARDEIVVYPAVAPTEQFYEILPLLSGEIESYERGRGHDLYSIRDYEVTDSVRHVDWKATARTQEIKVREFTREDERRVQLVFDPFLPAEARNDPEWAARFERAVSFCACLAWHFHEIHSQMQFVTPDLKTPVAAADEIVYDALGALARVEPVFGKETDEEENFLAPLRHDSVPFKVVLTARAAGSLPTSLWANSYVVFFQSL